MTILFALSLLAAAAVPLPPALTQEASAEPTWYGTQTLIADAASVSLVIGGYALGNGFGTPMRDTESVMVVAGTALYLVGGPLVHARHGDGWKALIDVGLRVGLPVVGFGFGLLLSPDRYEFGPLGWGLMGALAGGVAGMAFDAVRLAWAPAPQSAPAGGTKVQLSPLIGASRTGTPVAGIAGMF